MDLDYPSDFNISETPPPNSNKTLIIIIIICLFILCISGFITAYYIFTKPKTSNSTLSSYIPSFDSSSSSNLASKTTTSSGISAKIQSNKPMPILPIKIPKSSEKRTPVDIICTVNINDFMDFSCTDPKTDETADNIPENMPEYPAYSSTKQSINIINGKVFKLSFSEEVNTSGNKILDYYVLVPYAFIVDFIIDLSLGAIKIQSLQDLFNTFDKIDSDFDKLTVASNKPALIPDKCLKLQPSIRGESKPPYNTTCIFFPGLSKIGALSDTIEKILLPYIPENVQNEYFNMIDKKIKDTPIPTLTVIDYVIFLSMLNRLKKKKIDYKTECNSSEPSNSKIVISC